MENAVPRGDRAVALFVLDLQPLKGVSLMSTRIRKVRTVLLSAAVLLCLTSVSNGQISLQVGGGLGYAMPSSDFSGSTVEYFAGKNYGLSSGLNIHGKLRFGILGLRLAGEASYSFFSNDGEAQPGQGTLETKKRILALKVGPEFHLSLPAVPITPYLGLNVAFNSFSGSTTFQGVSGVSSGTFDLTGASRIGIGGTVGTLVNLAGTNLDIALHYNLHNLTGKGWEGADNLIDTFTGLNDDKDPAYAPGDNKHVVQNSRSIHSIVLSVSVMFGF